MKLAVCSDLHLEFGDLELKNPGGAEVLILSGDIVVAAQLDSAFSSGSTLVSRKYQKFFQECSEQFKHVLYVAGNHEHYHGDFKETVPRLKRHLAYLNNLYVLDNETFVLDDTVFVGGTLWTDMNREDPVTLQAIRGMMNDFRCVENSNNVVHHKAFDGFNDDRSARFKTRPARFTPEDAVNEHKKMLEYVGSVYDSLPEGKRMVVVGHHTPSYMSCDPMYAGDKTINGGYHSDLSDFILDRPRITLWTHGHTHNEYDYMVGTTRVVCNPRGYCHEVSADNFKLKEVEV